MDNYEFKIYQVNVSEAEIDQKIKDWGITEFASIENVYNAVKTIALAKIGILIESMKDKEWEEINSRIRLSPYFIISSNSYIVEIHIFPVESYLELASQLN